MTATRFVGRPHDFDFLIGDWHIANRRLRQRHVGRTDWDEFDGTSTALVMLDGTVSIDENRFPAKGFSGVTIRSLDRGSQQWAIYWINSADGRLFPPVHGGFDGGRGEFYGEDIDSVEGIDRTVQVRFVWTRIDAENAHWEQAFSPDGCAWETNWTMTLSRR